MKKRGRYEKQMPIKRGNGKRTGLIIAIVILALLLAVIGAGVIYYKSMIGKMNQVEVPKVNYAEETTEAVETTLAGLVTEPEETSEVTTEETTQPHVASSADYLNILVVGQASRYGEEERFADTMILCTINTYEKTLTLTSFPRDTQIVQGASFKGHSIGNIKLTTVYHLGSHYTSGDANQKIAGSMELMNTILYKNFGVEVDHNFEIDFEAFIDVIDMLGGIWLDLTKAEADYLNADDHWVRYEVNEGRCVLDGMGALCYARMRKAEGDSDSDIARTARQRKLIEALINQVRGKSLSDLQSIANKILPMITTSMTTSEVTDVLLTLLPMLPELKIEKGGTCPANYWGDMVDIYGDGMYHSVLHFDVAETKRYMRALTEGETAD